jgi:sulfate permease, SulP family
VETNQLDDRALLADLQEVGLPRLPRGMLVYEIAGPIFFGAIESFERALLQTHSDPDTLIIRLRHVPFMDATGLQTFAEVVGKLRKRGIDVMLCEANPRVATKLSNAGIFALLGEDRYVQEFHAALVSALANRASSRPPPASLNETANKMLEVTRRYFQDAGEGRD